MLRIKKDFALVISLFLMILSCTNLRNPFVISANFTNPIPGVKDFKQIIDGKETGLFILTNKNKITAAITNYGARLVCLYAPDRNSKMVDVVKGFSTLQQYRDAKGPYFGATIGRYANRIAHGQFNLNGVDYQLKINNGENILHGGNKGFHTKIWTVEKATKSSVELSYISNDNEEGFPGRLQVKVLYHLTNKNELEIKYFAASDKPTIINLTNHSFFNLNGESSGDISNHLLFINADNYTPVTKSLIPTGHIQNVNNTPFDFRKEMNIGKHINDSDVQLQYTGGYDHNFVLNKSDKEAGLAATVFSPQTGIFMQVFTDQPGVQLFTANAFKGLDQGKGGIPIGYRSAFCLETQHFPNSPNEPSFPSTVLLPGEVFRSKTIFKFSYK